MIREVHRAMRNPVFLDMRQAEAVDARIELDLRIGASFTRFQTLNLQHEFPELAEGVISYGTSLTWTLSSAIGFLHGGIALGFMTVRLKLLCYAAPFRSMPVSYLGVRCGPIPTSRELYTRKFLEIGNEAQQGWCRCNVYMAARTSFRPIDLLGNIRDLP